MLFYLSSSVMCSSAQKQLKVNKFSDNCFSVNKSCIKHSVVIWTKGLPKPSW